MRARAARSFRESDLRGHLINEVDLDAKALEVDKIQDPRFRMSAEELKAKGIDDFQMYYAIRTIRNTAPGALLAAKR
jgi:carboxyl-terminal processing protease